MLQLAADAAAVGIWVADEQGITVFVNRTMTALLGRDASEVIGRPRAAWIAEPPPPEREFEVPRAGTAVAHQRIDLPRADGSEVAVFVSTSAVVDEHGVRGSVSLVADLSSSIPFERALDSARDRYRLLFDYSNDIVTVLDAEGGLKYTSPSAMHVLGYPDDYDPEGGAFSLLHWGDLPLAVQVFEDVLAGRRDPDERFVVRLRAADSSWHYLECVARDATDQPLIAGVIITARDITVSERLQLALRQTERILSATLAATPVGVSLIDLSGDLIQVNPAFCQQAGRDTAELVGSPARDLLHPDDQSAAADAYVAMLASGRATPPLEQRLLLPDGRVSWVEASSSIVLDDQGKPGFFVKITVDINERRRLLDMLERHALEDPLTGLPNRRHLDQLLAMALARAERTSSLLGACFVDLDALKRVNDTRGHAAGDQVLQQVAERLRVAVRQGDLVTRLGGDEFVVICEPVTGLEELTVVAERIAKALTEPYELGQDLVYCTGSVGATLAGAGDSGTSLLERADEALYAAKAAGKARAVVI
jgi:diguanylate cyclase (GGDEF)-like protein/PAS domain S-box-containing protein